MKIDPAVEVLRDGNSRTHLLYFTGREYMHVVILDGHVHLAKLPLIERRYLTPLQYKSKPYPVARACRMLKRAGDIMGITDGARQALNLIKEIVK